MGSELFAREVDVGTVREPVPVVDLVFLFAACDVCDQEFAAE
ncbi:hypothetical protein ACIQJU_19630 [Pseudarthrobacter oxydans]